MHSLHGAYAQGFNEKWTRVGHLFQSRFGSRLVHDELGLMRVLAYIEANPVAAGLCTGPADWPWSSYRAVAAGKNDTVPDLNRLHEHVAPHADLADLYEVLVSGALRVNA
jgi:hypothetical protein